MRNYLLLLLLFFNLSTFGQPLNKHYVFKEIGWEIDLPPAFIKMSVEADAAMNQKGKNAIESTINQSIDVSATKTLISATKDIYEYFNTTIRHFNVKVEGDYNAGNAALKKIMYDTFKEKMPKAVIDSASTSKLISRQKFDKFTVHATIDDKKLFTMVLCSKLYRGYDLGISYLFMKPETEVEIEKMLNHSSFSKN
jgi:hypothetical protein